MLAEGLNLMLVGMGTVFSFLALLVAVMVVSARVFELAGYSQPNPDVAGSQAGINFDQEQAKVAVILAAVEDYRRQK